jgi:hypothetical protein
MNRKPRRRAFHFESLEDRRVLSTVNPTVPGGTILSAIGTPVTGTVSSSDAQIMQTDASTNLLEAFLAQTELLFGTNSNTETYAAGLVADNRDASFALQALANAKGVTLPSGLSATDAQTALGVLKVVNTSTFEQTLLKALVQTQQTLVNEAQTQASTATDTQLQMYLSNVLTLDQGHLAAAQALVAGTTPTPTTSTATAATSTLSATDASVAQSAYSSSVAAAYLSEVAAIENGTSSGVSTPVGTLASYVLNNQSIDAMMLGLVAAQTGTSLTAGIDPADTSAIAAVVTDSATTASLNTAYLSTITQLETSAQTTGTAAMSTLSNTTLRQMIPLQVSVDTYNLERAQVLTSNTSPADHYILQLYNTMLGRVPTASELTYWTHQLARGIPAVAVYNLFFHSSERQSLVSGSGTGTAATGTNATSATVYGSNITSLTTNQAYVDSLYVFLLGRTPDTTSETHWIDLLNKGASRNYVLRMLLKSADFSQAVGV